MARMIFVVSYIERIILNLIFALLLDLSMLPIILLDLNFFPKVLNYICSQAK